MKLCCLESFSLTILSISYFLPTIICSDTPLIGRNFFFNFDNFSSNRAAVAGCRAKTDVTSFNGVWGRALNMMKRYPERTFTQIYGLFSLAKCNLPVASDGILDFVRI